jgi:hypothetical protein
VEPLVVYIYDRPGGYQELLERQLKKKHIEFLPVEIPAFTWGNRILQTAAVAADTHPDRPLCFVDAWDTLFLGEAWELRELGTHAGIVFATQKRCWPDAVELGYNKFWEHKASTRWRYLNSNPMLGHAGAIATAIKWGWERFPLEGHTNDTCDAAGNVCERFYTRLLFRAPTEWGLKLDTECRLSQTTTDSEPGELGVRNGRIHNLVTNTEPVFLHLNGKMVTDVSLFDV